MTACVNKVTLIGFLGEDPVRREMRKGGQVVTMDIATSETWRSADGERKSLTEWHKIAIFNEPLGKIAMSYLRKGSAVYVEGQIRSRPYTDRDGGQRKIVEIVVPKFGGEVKLMDPRQDEAARREETGRDRAAGDGDRGLESDLDDKVPY